MTSCTCAVVGAGSQGWVHAQGYQAALASHGAALVAVADTNVQAARDLAAERDIPGLYDSHEAMLKAEHPDVISICTPPATHLEIARAAIAAEVRAIHCEKPIATSYGDVLEMQRLARDANVQLTVNLQRRFEPVHRFARDQIAAGAIGEVVSLEGYCPNLPDWGSHIVDLRGHGEVGGGRGLAPGARCGSTIGHRLFRGVEPGRRRSRNQTEPTSAPPSPAQPRRIRRQSH